MTASLRSTPDDHNAFAGPAIVSIVPSTAAQREIWAATSMGDASLAFNEAVQLDLHGPLDAAALQAAVDAIVARHEALRAVFTADGLQLLVLEQPATVPLAAHDWRARPAADAQAALAALLGRVVSEPFDLVNGPLVRFDVVHLTDTSHVLVVTAHHIVCDGWSFGVVASELADLYSAHAEGRAPALAAAPTFTEYATQRESPEVRADVAAAERYWVAQYPAPVAPLDLPTDHARPPVRVYDASRVDRVLSADLVRRAARAGARAGQSLFATLFGAFGILLHRLSGQEEIVVAVPTAGQPVAGVPGLVGHLVHTLPVRLYIASDAPLRDAVAHVRRQVLDAQEHQAVTLGALLALLPFARDPGRPPLVSVAFNLDNGLGASALRFRGLKASLAAVPRSHENFDLFLNAVELDGAVTLECQYNTVLYDRATVVAWLAAYERLVDALATDGALDRAVGDLPLVDDVRAAALHGATIALPARPLVHRLIEAQAARTLDAVAVDDGARTLTYAELEARANRLARHLRANGVRRGALVGLCLDRTVELVIAVVAVLKAGGAYVPLDPGFPHDRLAFMAEDARLAALVIDDAVRAEVPLAAPVVVSVDADAAAIAAQADTPLADDADAADPDGPAYVLYTSGSTGRPKGVAVPHRALVNLLLSVQHTPGMTADDVVLAITTLSFDIATSEVVLPLTVGARIVLVTRDVAADGPRLREVVERSGVTFIDATPATYRLLLAAGWTGGTHLRVICTGEAMPRELGDELCARARAVWNGYGPTETTVWSTFWRVRAPVERVLIGHPVANTRAYVLDPRRQPVPAGARGELFIGGVGLALGYLHRPELTAERFVADPFATEPGTRLYRTGDVVRVTADGSLECLGRNDDQVKLRGFRIELGEIESRIEAHSGVGAAAALVREDVPGDRRLVAYVTPSADGATPEPSDAVLRAHLQETLPDYMLPQAIVRLPVLPLTPSGKIDRQALPAPRRDENASAASGPDGYVEPRTDAERLVAALWAEVLHLGRVSAHDDFFQLGGHSLLASQLLGRLRRDHGVQLPYRRIFEAPTVARFAALVSEAVGVGGANGAASSTAAATSIPHDPGRTRAQLTVLQQRIWRLEELDPTSARTHVHSAAWRLRGALNVDAVERALADFVARHDQMRTRFVVVDGAPVQEIAPAAMLPLARIDLSAVPATERQDALERTFADLSDEPFDLASAPLLRAALVTLAPDEHVLATARHGLVWDGWSFDIFINEFAARYNAHATGRAGEDSAGLPALPVTFADFAAWQPAHLSSDATAAGVAWWRAHLGDDIPVLELPTDRDRPAQSMYAGAQVTLAVTKGEVDQLTLLARAHGATLYMVLLAAYTTLLHRHARQREILVGTPVRARTRPELEGVVGGFVNTVMLRLAVDPDAPFTALLTRVRDVTLDGFGHQDVPFELLGNKLPVVRALFSMQDARGRVSEIAGMRLEQVHVPLRSATNDLLLWTMERHDGLLAVLNYSTELFDAPTAERFMHQLRTLLRAVTDEPQRAVARLPLLTDAERAAALGAPARDAGALNAATPIDVVARVAAMRRDAVAVRGADGEVGITYGALLARAAAVRDVVGGLGTGARIAVLAGDLAARTAAVLGVLAAGGTVLPLDPRDPARFNDALVAAAAIEVVVVDGAGCDALGGSLPRVVLDALPEAAWTAPVGVAADVPALLLHDVDAAGRPVAVPVPHGALATVVADVTARLALEEAMDVLVLDGPAAAGWSAVLLAALGAGAVLIDAPGNADVNGDALAELLAHARPRLVLAPAASWQALEASGWPGDARLEIVVTDDAPDALLRTLTTRVRRVRVAATAAAAGGWYALGEVSAADAGARVAPLTQGIAGARLFVLDDSDEACPPGVPGWLHVGGPTVDAILRGAPIARSADPLVPGAYAWPTGDLARRADTGAVTIAAPASGTLRRGGRVVALASIDAVLRARAGVADAAVAVRPDANGESKLVAFVVPKRVGAAYTDTELRRDVRAVQPAAAVPDRFVTVEAIPRRAAAPCGAVRRDALPSLATGAAGGRPHLPPRTVAEQRVAALWQEVLGVERVGLTDNFFDRGGYSLLCFRVVDRIARETGVRVSPRVVLLGTLEQVAAEVDRAAPSDASRSAAGSARADAAGAGRDSVGGASPDPARTGGIFGRLKGMLGGGRA